MWHNNKLVLQTFASHHGQNAWANIEGLGWKKIKPNAADGVTNLFILMNAAKANGRRVNVHLDADQIDIAYML